MHKTSKQAKNKTWSAHVFSETCSLNGSPDTELSWDAKKSKMSWLRDIWSANDATFPRFKWLLRNLRRRSAIFTKKVELALESVRRCRDTPPLSLIDAPASCSADWNWFTSASASCFADWNWFTSASCAADWNWLTSASASCSADWN